jgi:hypothetical protein
MFILITSGAENDRGINVQKLTKHGAEPHIPSMYNGDSQVLSFTLLSINISLNLKILTIVDMREQEVVCFSW